MNGASRAWTANERSNDEYGDGYDIEDMDQDDVGTFTGLALDSSETDEVSCLMSVCGVEDTWNGASPIKKVEPETAQTIAQTTQTSNETFAQTTQFTQSNKSTQSNPNNHLYLRLQHLHLLPQHSKCSTKQCPNTQSKIKC